MAKAKKKRAVRSLRDAELLIAMHGNRQRYKVRMKCLYGIHHAGSIQRLLRRQIQVKRWRVEGISHLDALAVVHRLISDSSNLLNDVIRESALMHAGTTTAMPGSDGDDDDDHTKTVSIDEEHLPLEGLRGQPLPPFPTIRRFGDDRASGFPEREGPRGVGASIITRRFTAAEDLSRFDADDGPPFALFPTSRRSGAEDDRAARVPGNDNDRLHEGAPYDHPAPRRHVIDDHASPRLVPDVEQPGGFRGKPLLLEYPYPRRLSTYASATIDLSERTLEAGTGSGGQPLLRAPAIVDLAARVVAGESPQGVLSAYPAYRTLVTDLLDSGRALRRHEVGSSSVQLIVQELGRQIEHVAADILTARHPPPVLLEYLRAVKECLHMVWKLRIPASEFSQI